MWDQTYVDPCCHTTPTDLQACILPDGLLRIPNLEVHRATCRNGQMIVQSCLLPGFLGVNIGHNEQRLYEKERLVSVMFMLVILVTQPAEDLGDTSRVGAAEAHHVDSTIESSLGKEQLGNRGSC